jgi:hypothetical protein
MTVEAQLREKLRKIEALVWWRIVTLRRHRRERFASLAIGLAIAAL